MDSVREKLIKQLDNVFSIVVRKREADQDGFVTCVTCPTNKHWSQMTCGHHRKRRHLSTRWELKNAGPQCGECNGQDLDISKYLDNAFGEGTAEAMEQLSHKDVHFSNSQLKTILENLTKFL